MRQAGRLQLHQQLRGQLTGSALQQAVEQLSQVVLIVLSSTRRHRSGRHCRPHQAMEAWLDRVPNTRHTPRGRAILVFSSSPGHTAQRSTTDAKSASQRKAALAQTLNDRGNYVPERRRKKESSIVQTWRPSRWRRRAPRMECRCGWPDLAKLDRV
jgi:hypothetical protein